MTDEKIFIEGVGCCFANGCDIDAATDAISSRHITKTLESIKSYPDLGELPVFKAKTDQLQNYINKKNLRRIDHFTKMTLLAAFKAKENASLDETLFEDTGLIICTGFGPLKTNFDFLDSYINYGDKSASPLSFSHSVHNAAAASVAINLKLKGPTITITQFKRSFFSGLQTALCWLKTKRVSKVLIGTVDEFHPMIGFYYNQKYNLNKETEMNPLNLNLQSAIPGEGSAFFVLGKAENNYGSVSAKNIEKEQYLKFLKKDLTIIPCLEGHKACDKPYKEILNHDFKNYSALFGSFPTNSAFNLLFGLVDPDIKKDKFELIQAHSTSSYDLISLKKQSDLNYRKCENTTESKINLK